MNIQDQIQHGVINMKPKWDGYCHRCGQKVGAHIMSKFNFDLICSVCKTKETKHPKYAEASLQELCAVKDGIRDFPGIGKPADL